jgi:Tfp pilus assembly pilus retraction ATPase PilT
MADPNKPFEESLIEIIDIPSNVNHRVFNQLLDEGQKAGASDVIFRSGTTVRARLSGGLVKITNSEIDAGDIVRFIEHSENSQTVVSLQAGNPKSFAYTIDIGNHKRKRFRMSASSVNDKRGEYGLRLVCRPIKDRPIPLDELNLPAELAAILTTKNNNGLIILSGPTGSGKTTLLAAIIERKAQESGINIATLEDPIEFNLTYLNDETDSIVAQAAVGRNLASFQLGLRGLLRDNPDVIMVGEMRDTETIQLGVEASRTGHLVYSTIHVTSVSAIVDRMSIPFRDGEQIQMASSIIDSLRCGVNQDLVPKLCGCALPIKSLDKVIADFVDATNAKSPNGCELCGHKGYRGRTPLIEYVILTNDARTRLKTILIKEGLAGVSIYLHNIIDEYGQSKLRAAQKAFESGLISQEQFISVFIEYQTLEFLHKAGHQNES